MRSMAYYLLSPGFLLILGPEPSADELSISSLRSSSLSGSESYLSSSTALLEYRLLFLLLSDLILIFVYFCIWKSYSFEVEPFYGDCENILVPYRLKLVS